MQNRYSSWERVLLLRARLRCRGHLITAGAPHYRSCPISHEFPCTPECTPFSPPRPGLTPSLHFHHFHFHRGTEGSRVSAQSLTPTSRTQPSKLSHRSWTPIGWTTTLGIGPTYEELAESIVVIEPASRGSVCARVAPFTAHGRAFLPLRSRK